MVWVFLIGIVQGLFLIIILVYRHSRNHMASRLLIAMIVPILVIHSGYLVIRTEGFYVIPQVFGLSFGLMFLFGPLMWLYGRSVLDAEYKWRPRDWLHFLPFGIQFALNIPFLAEDAGEWQSLIRELMSGRLKINPVAMTSYGLQTVHLVTYLLYTARMVGKTDMNHRYMVPVEMRIVWMKRLLSVYALLAITLAVVVTYISLRGVYNPLTHYVQSLITTAIVYICAFRFVLDPEVIRPDFSQKYAAYAVLSPDEESAYEKKIRKLFEEEKLFQDPDLNLAVLAERLDLSTHRVSQLINKKFGKTFAELVNEYRVNEFLRRLNAPEFQSHSVLAIALDVGFRSKSAFNSAFKRITGKTPSDFRQDT